MIREERLREPFVQEPQAGASAGPYRGDPSAVAAAEAYVATELATAPPQRLQTVLYDAAVRICRQAVSALDAGQLAPAAEHLGRARTVLLHLQAALPTDAAPGLSGELAELYRQVHRRLIEADYYRKRETVQESIELLDRRRPALRAFVEALGPHSRRIDRAGWVG